MKKRSVRTVEYIPKCKSVEREYNPENSISYWLQSLANVQIPSTRGEIWIKVLALAPEIVFSRFTTGLGCEVTIFVLQHTLWLIIYDKMIRPRVTLFHFPCSSSLTCCSVTPSPTLTTMQDGGIINRYVSGIWGSCATDMRVNRSRCRGAWDALWHGLACGPANPLVVLRLMKISTVQERALITQMNIDGVTL